MTIGKKHTRVRILKMINNVTHIGTAVARNLHEKINNFTNELMKRDLLKELSPKDKRDISVMINEIKYDSNRIKNIRFVR